jgi:hypothetical protein
MVTVQTKIRSYVERDGGFLAQTRKETDFGLPFSQAADLIEIQEPGCHALECGLDKSYHDGSVDRVQIRSN